MSGRNLPGRHPGNGAGAGLLFLRETQIRAAQQLLLLAWRDLGEAVEPALAAEGLGHAHHRVLQILAFRPGLTVGELQKVLGLTRQSLSRTMGELLERDLVVQKPGHRDRRQKFLELTAKGIEVEARLFGFQRDRIVAAYREAGGEAVAGFRKVLTGILGEDSSTLLSERQETDNRRRT
ncbi:MAG: MarR family transcriptional regulator [Acetobacter sp.]|jgi:DNA-binding MarR family transcriptional regulator|nr:MarR family transcriptional regulator [Acetobacter sp.]MCH4061815.1 MarR family transcriptional regulator [Acetobacter sp.]MCH4089336.1 MarR family transcriptional regulator [Acetobacter sp.]MCI1294186.1 MarR family transcriptional regulator [Acetobacter sp.]MCI1320771.1 MarR family transcriptional regulator [Acetobacter sp.]